MTSIHKLIVSCLLTATAILTAGCSSTKKLSQQTASQTTEKTEVRYERIIKTDTVFVSIPLQTAERTTFAGESHLENEYAESDARLNDDGSLYHTLKTKQQEKSVPVQTVAEKTDSVATKVVTVEVPVEVEKKLSWWDSTKLSSWRYIALVALISTSILVISNRKIIYKFLSRLVVLVKRLI